MTVNCFKNLAFSATDDYNHKKLNVEEYRKRLWFLEL